MSDPNDMVTAVGAGGVGTGALLLAFQHFFRRVDKDGDEVKAALARIEAKQNGLHTDLLLFGGRITAMEKTVEFVQERINGGLTDHRMKLENLAERVVRVETKLEESDE